MAEMHGGGVDRELNFKAIFGFVIGLAVVCLVVFALVWGIAVWQKSRLVRKDPPPPVLVEARTKEPPPGPLLQRDPEKDLRTFRAEEAALLAGWSWADASKTHARIPVDRAIEIVLTKGFPPRTAAPPEPAPASSSGAAR